MNDSHNEPDLDRLKKLVNKKCNGVLSSQGYVELDEMLAKSDKLRREYWELIGIHADLEWEFAGRENSDCEVIRLLPEDSEENSTAVVTTARTSVHSAGLGWSHLAIAAGLMGILLGGWSVWYLIDNPMKEQTAHTEQESNIGSPQPLEGEMHTAAQLAALAPNSRWSCGRPGDDNADDLRIGDTVWVEDGMIEMRLESGTVGELRAPAILQLLTMDRVRLLRGRIKVDASQGEDGFTVETPSAEVVDLGTVFSVESADTGTNLVVFDGKVDLIIPTTGEGDNSQPLSSKQFTTGQAVHVDKNGTLSRIMNVQTSDYTDASSIPTQSITITSVTDNVVRDDHWAFYEIVSGGMKEDVRAYVDRFHEWNGVTPSGIPDYLLGGDYVKMFNDDKIANNLLVEVTLSRPAILYVLLDDRVSPPEWLVNSFSNTGDEIGVDESPHDTANRYPGNKAFAQIGPGESIDRTHSIWKKVIAGGGTVFLGPNGRLPVQEGLDNRPHYVKANMYGIVAVPLEPTD